jgi:hypothetical protein
MSDFNAIRFVSGRPLLRELSADRLNTILTEIRRNRPKGERGITVRQDGTGTYIGLAAALTRGGGGGTPALPQPWDLRVQIDPNADPEDEDPPNLVQVRPGTLNGILPINWNIEEIIESEDEDLYYAKAVIATDGQDITGATIEIDTNAPEIATSGLFSVPTSIDYLFGLYQSGQVYRVIGDGHIVVSPQVWLTVERGGALPGELPYELYYNVLS